MSTGRKSIAFQIARKQSEAREAEQLRREARVASDDLEQRKKALQPHITKIMRDTGLETATLLRRQHVTPGKNGYLGIVAIGQTGRDRAKGYPDGFVKRGVLLHAFGSLIAFSDLETDHSHALIDPQIKGPAADDDLAPTSSIEANVGVDEQAIVVDWCDSLTNMAISLSEGERYDPHWWGGTHLLH